MKRIIRYTFFNLTVAVLFMSALFIGCSNLAKDTNAEQTAGCYTVSGNITIESKSGAIPAALNTNKDVSTFRSATSSFSNKSEISWTVTAFQKDSDGNMIESTKTTTTANPSFTFSLVSSGEWYFSAEGFISENKVAASSESTKLIISNEGNNTITLKAFPIHSTETSGSINLTIEDDTENMGPLSFLKYSGENITEGTVEFSEKTAIINIESIPAGNHELKFQFYNAANTEVFSCPETITVFSGFTTDTWYGESEYMHQNENTYIFKLDDNLLETYQKTNIVDVPVILWGESKFSVFTEEQIEENVSISDTSIIIGRGTVKDFCIDSITQKIYVLEDDNIIKYPTYAGYNRGQKIVQDQNIKTFCAYNNTLWYTIYDDENFVYSFYRYKNGESASFTTVDATDKGIPFETKPLLAADDDYLYTLTNVNSGESSVTESTFTIKKFAIPEATTGTITQIAEFTTTATELGIFDSESTVENQKLCTGFKATDFILSDDGSALYLLISDLNGAHSRGGLIKLANTVNGDTHTIALEELSGSKVYGWYSDAYCTPAVANGEKLNTDLHYETDETINAEQKEAARNSFYGPQKFIARKPDELYIADEGSYDSSSNEDRVIKLNLNSLSKTITDVNVRFNSYNDSGFHGQNGI